MRMLLIFLFASILLAMVGATIVASQDRSVFDAGDQLLSDRWFQVTLLDAYCGFITFYVWVAYKERAAWSRALWFVLIMGLGNMAMAVYVLIQLIWLPGEAPLSRVLLRDDTDSTNTAASTL